MCVSTLSLKDSFVKSGYIFVWVSFHKKMLVGMTIIMQVVPISCNFWSAKLSPVWNVDLSSFSQLYAVW